ncbi:MAG: 2-C-methyl-D-erythritol 4-phosphate cytidylyltransferase [Actinobacteria bacterium]|nr:MAG: 2-C-methyl-D-erythritol 4-phosphate cytidylyltransferase [Actinomycetota bacterium]
MSGAGLLLAAGAGRRLGWAIPKAFVPLAGRPMLEYSLSAMAASGVVSAVVLIVPESERRRVEETIADLRSGALISAVVSGGTTRRRSVQRGLAAVQADATTIVCHDAARPFATPALFVRVVEGLRDVDGCIPTVPVPDTLKRTRDGRVMHTIPREDVVLAQTPQAFVCASLRAAHDAENVEEATDDALLLEARGMPIATVAGEPGNFKITTPEDLRRAEEIVARRGLAPAER